MNLKTALFWFWGTVGGSRFIVKRNWLEMEKQERGKERGGGIRATSQRWTVVDRGQGPDLKSNQSFQFLYQPFLSSIHHHTSLPAVESDNLMSPKPISTLAIPRSTLFALSQAGYETTDELASSTPEGLARGNPLFSDQGAGPHFSNGGMVSMENYRARYIRPVVSANPVRWLQTTGDSIRSRVVGFCQ